MLPNLNGVLDAFTLDNTNRHDGTDKRTLHSYIDHIYQPLINFGALPESILEIGVFRGGSIALWTKSFPSAHVTSIDINTSNLVNRIAIDAIASKRATVIEGNAYEGDCTIQGKYDWIIDDGPHTLHTQKVALGFVEYLNNLGILIIEDVPFSYNHMRQLFGVMIKVPDIEVLFVPLVLKKGRFDDCVLIAAKGISIKSCFPNAYAVDDLSDRKLLFLYTKVMLWRPFSFLKSKTKRFFEKFL